MTGECSEDAPRGTVYSRSSWLCTITETHGSKEAATQQVSMATVMSNKIK